MDKPVNFDLERMKRAVEGPYITIPKGMKRDELRKWLSEERKRRGHE